MVINYIAVCEVCQRNKGENVQYPGLLQPLPIPDQAWRHISFIEELPKSKGKEIILVVVDRRTKYAHFMTLAHPFTAVTVAHKFLKQVRTLHDIPESIVTNRDKIFLSNFRQALFRLLGTPLHYSTTYHPQSDGQTERVNQCIENYLRCMTSSRPIQWKQWLPLTEWWTTPTSTLVCSVLPLRHCMGSAHLIYPSALLLRLWFLQLRMVMKRQQTQQLLQDNLNKAQERMKLYDDKRKTEREFQVGDMVFLKLQPYRQSSVAIRRNLKLSSKYYGPYKILEKVGSVVYKLELPVASKVRPVFHVSLLKRKLGTNVLVQTCLPSTSEDGQFLVAPISILQRQMVRKGNVAAVKILVQWSNLPPEDATWEDYDFLKAKFSNFDP